MTAKIAYVDTSCLVAIAFEEPGFEPLARILEAYDRLFSSNLLEAELQSVFTREAITEDGDLLTAVSWVLPQRALSKEIRRVAERGYVRGADLWHLACALYVAGDELDKLVFATLDRRQGQVAEQIGFPSLERS